MKRAFGTLFFCALASSTFAATWDEPWHRDVVLQADSVGLYDVLSVSASTAVFRRVRQLAGMSTGERIEVHGFYRSFQLATSLSRNGRPDDELNLRFRRGGRYYLFLQKSQSSNTWQIATPSTGFAKVESNGTVAATFRISVHETRIAQDIYELTQTCIFRTLHHDGQCQQNVSKLIAEQLASEPASLSERSSADEAGRFYRQHVALETAYLIGYPLDHDVLSKYLRGSSVHTQISAVRALAVSNHDDRDALLMAFVVDDTRDPLARVCALMMIRDVDARELTVPIARYASLAPVDEVSLGIRVSDSRIGTIFPHSLREGLSQLATAWSRERSQRGPGRSFDLNATQLISLKKSGVPDAAVAELQRASAASIARDFDNVPVPLTPEQAADLIRQALSTPDTVIVRPAAACYRWLTEPFGAAPGEEDYVRRFRAQFLIQPPHPRANDSTALEALQAAGLLTVQPSTGCGFDGGPGSPGTAIVLTPRGAAAAKHWRPIGSNTWEVSMARRTLTRVIRIVSNGQTLTARFSWRWTSLEDGIDVDPGLVSAEATFEFENGWKLRAAALQRSLYDRSGQMIVAPAYRRGTNLPGAAASSQALESAPGPGSDDPESGAKPTEQRTPPVGITNADVVKMFAAGLRDDVIIQAIRFAANRLFDLSADAITEVRNAGVPDRLIVAMRTGGQVPLPVFATVPRPREQSSSVTSRTATLSNGRLIVRQELERGANIYIEGSIGFVVVSRGSTRIVDAPLRNDRFERELPAGSYTVESYQRACDGNCGLLDPPSDRCSRALEIISGQTTPMVVRLNPGRGCAIDRDSP